MDQSFSPRNLRRIWDTDARRGQDRLALYPDVRREYDRARNARRTARQIASGSVVYIGPPEQAPDLVAKEARASAELLLAEALSSTSELLTTAVERDAFRWGLRLGPLIGGTRQTYSIESTAEAFFADKQLQCSVGALLASRPRGRQSIVGGLVRTLNNDLPKVIIRADVMSFYDSVDHRRLRAMLEATALSPTSKRLVAQLLAEMEALTGRSVGLPAGVGLSAKLAEVFIAQADRALRDLPGTLYYARYVDDIVLVRGETEVAATDPRDVVTTVDDELQLLGLALNPSKVMFRQLSKSKTFSSIEFLGYELDYRGKRGLSVKLAPRRYVTIRFRIDRAFDAWDRADPANHGRRRLLLDRLRLLTGNTRLSHNKRNAMVGIYFSNPHLNDIASLEGLDKFLHARASKSILPPEMKAKIDGLSFVNGFQDRSIRRFSMHDLKRLRGAWYG